MNSSYPVRLQTWFRSGLILLLGIAGTSATWATANPAELVEQAESFYTGTAGVVDDARAHELFVQAAATGDPRAVLRVATLHHFGKGGFGHDPERAAAMARPILDQVVRLAEEGDAKAQYLIGTVEFLGIGQPPDSRAGLAWYERAARGGEILAMHNLGWAYGAGQGVEQDREKAFSWYLRAARAGYAASMYEVSRAYFNGWGVASDPEQWAQWLQQSAERRHPLAMAVLGGELMAGEHLPRNLEEGARWTQASADAGEVQGQYGLARAYLFGLGVPRDGERARSLFREAAARGHSDCQAYVEWLDRLGPGAEEGTQDQADLMAKGIVDGHEWAAEILTQWFLKGMVVTEQNERVRSRLERATEAGSVTAQATLAGFYYDGHLGTGRDFERAVEMSRKAAVAGSGRAMRTIGHAYNTGQGLPRDRQQALSWWEKAAAAGDSQAMLWLGYAYVNGDGYERDIRRGLEWIERAGAAGHYHAMKYLAQVYDQGMAGVPRDKSRARHWYERLAAMGDEEARGWLRFEELAGNE